MKQPCARGRIEQQQLDRPIWAGAARCRGAGYSREQKRPSDGAGFTYVLLSNPRC